MTLSLLLAADVPSLDDIIAKSYTFHGDVLVIGLIWCVWVVLNLWIWQKTKAQSNLLMLGGSGAMALTNILASFTWHHPGIWLEMLGLGALSAGFFMSVRPLVEAHLTALKNKLGGGKGGGTPPAA